MDSGPTQNAVEGAVFLSYAKEDAEAVKPIAEALRAAGIETWFDQDELEGGDAWDFAIRRQIRECSLFIPVVSRSTLNRLEGYFRREWRLAIERSQDMADEKAFLVPIVIDGTKDSAHGIPEKFRQVQWTRVESPSDRTYLAQRVRSLLVAGLSPAEKKSARGAPSPPSPFRPHTRRRGPLAAGLLALLAAAAGLALWLKFRPEAGPATAPTESAHLSAPAIAATSFPSDPDLIKAWNLIYGYRVDATGDRTEFDSGPEDFALAEDLAKAVLAQHPNDPEAVVVYAHINLWYYCRGFDRGDARYALAQKYAHRALELAPSNPEALIAMSLCVAMRSEDTTEARKLAERAIAINRNEPRYYRTLFYWVLRGDDRLRVAQDAVRRFPNDYLTLYDAGQVFNQSGRTTESEAAYDRAIELYPARSAALVMKAYFQFCLHGDVAGMKATLARVNGSTLLTSRFAYFSFLCAQLREEPGDTQSLVQALPDADLRDWFYTGPKALIEADLLKAEGKAELASLKYGQALERLNQELGPDPTNPNFLRLRAWSLLGLGRLDEAKAAAKLYLSAESRPIASGYWWYSEIPLFFALGDEQQGLVLLRECLDTNWHRENVRHEFAVDPRLKAWRDKPEVEAALASGAER